jgi:hypothetical protein
MNIARAVQTSPGAPPIPAQSDAYLYGGFAALQNIVNQVLTAHQLSTRRINATLPSGSVYVQQAATRADSNSFVSTMLSVQIPGLLVLAFIPLAIAVILPLLEEKSSGIRELLAMKGVSKPIYIGAHLTLFVGEGLLISFMAATLLVVVNFASHVNIVLLGAFVRKKL